MPACRRAEPGLYSCTRCFRPPSSKAMPSMNSEFVTIAPAMDALTRSNMPARRAVMRDHELREVAERRVEQAADRVPGPGRHALGGVTQQGRERDDRQHREHEQHRVGLGRGLLGNEHRRHGREQPEQRVLPQGARDSTHQVSSRARRGLMAVVVPVTTTNAGSAINGTRRARGSCRGRSAGRPTATGSRRPCSWCQPDRQRARLRAAAEVHRAAIHLALVVDEIDAVVGLRDLQPHAGVERLSPQRHDVGELPEIAARRGPVGLGAQFSELVAGEAARTAHHEHPVGRQVAAEV